MIQHPYVFLDHPTNLTRISSKLAVKKKRSKVDSQKTYRNNTKSNIIEKKSARVNKTLLAINTCEKDDTILREGSKPKTPSSQFRKTKLTYGKASSRAVSALKSNRVEPGKQKKATKLHIKCTNLTYSDVNKVDYAKENNCNPGNVVPVNKLLEMLKGIVTGRGKNSDELKIPQSTKGNSKPILKEDQIHPNKLLKTEYNEFITKAVQEVNAELKSKRSKINVTCREMKKDCTCLSGAFAYSLDHLLIGKQIGKGAYASVRLAFNKRMDRKVALKIYDKSKLMEPQKQRNLKNEIGILEKLNHPHILKLYSAFDTKNHVVLEMEYIGGPSLHGLLKSKDKRRLDEPKAKKILIQILKGLKHCHSNNISHRDIKLENLLLDENENIKIIDFGFSTCMPLHKKIRIFCGTPSYMSPEIVLRKEYAGPPADIWALGVLLYALLCGTFPFKGSTDKELYRHISQGKFHFPEQLSSASRSLISKMLTVNPNKRPNVYEILNDPWLVTSDEIIELNLKKNPPVNVEVSNGILRKRLDLTLNFSTSKLPLGTIPHSAANRNIGNNAIQTKCKDRKSVV